MASKMRVKFEKYWACYCTTLALGSVLDPKGKLKYLTFVYKKLYPQNYKEKVKCMKDALYKLFADYERGGVVSNTIPISCSFMSEHHDMDISMTLH